MNGELLLATALSVAYNATMATNSRLSDQLRKAILQSDKTRYRISIETGIAQSILSRFINQDAGLSLENVDRICDCIGARLVLVRPVKASNKKRRERE